MQQLEISLQDHRDSTTAANTPEAFSPPSSSQSSAESLPNLSAAPIDEKSESLQPKSTAGLDLLFSAIAYQDHSSTKSESNESHPPADVRRCSYCRYYEGQTRKTDRSVVTFSRRTDLVTNPGKYYKTCDYCRNTINNYRKNVKEKQKQLDEKPEVTETAKAAELIEQPAVSVPTPAPTPDNVENCLRRCIKCGLKEGQVKRIDGTLITFTPNKKGRMLKSCDFCAAYNRMYRVRNPYTRVRGSTNSTNDVSEPSSSLPPSSLEHSFNSTVTATSGVILETSTETPSQITFTTTEANKNGFSIPLPQWNNQSLTNDSDVIIPRDDQTNGISSLQVNGM
ncbi:hypothetical protein MP638_001101 [Amoeboaphelidium occidentale]|nr:hypothetical protein MP638_001101 [Amoeboaphelidium occidentale]